MVKYLVNWLNLGYILITDSNSVQHRIEKGHEVEIELSKEKVDSLERYIDDGGLRIEKIEKPEKVDVTTTVVNIKEDTNTSPEVTVDSNTEKEIVSTTVVSKSTKPENKTTNDATALNKMFGKIATKNTPVKRKRKQKNDTNPI